MKIQPKPYKTLKGFVAAGVTVAFAALPGVIAADDIEWDPTWGYHEEEWYDPSDWFNDDGVIDYEDTYDYDTNYWGADNTGYDDAYYYDDYWYDTYDYDYVDYGFHYVWDSAEQKWETDYGYHTGSYDIVYTPAMTAEQQQQQQTAQRDQKEGQEGQQQMAQQGQQEPLEQDEYAQTQTQEQREKPGRRLNRVNISGTIDGFRKMNLQTGDDEKTIEQTLARVTLENNNSYVVAMGDKKITEELKPKTGDKIEVQGISAMINGQPAVIAGQMKIGDKTVNIEREAAESIAFTGTVENFGKAEVEGRGEHLLVSLKFEEGRDKGKGIVVDFGPNTTMEDLKLKKGSKITVVGRKAQVGDKAVLVARQFNIISEQPSPQDQAAAQ